MKRVLLNIAFLPLAAAHCSTLATAAERPNIVLCMADDQGYGDAGYMGHPVLKTPTLDEMAQNGLRFDRFYAAHPVCSPTRGSVLTGRHPNRFACFCWGHTLRPEEVTLAEVLQKSGYATGHFGKWHVGSCNPVDEVSPGQSGFDHWVSSPNFYDNSPLFSKNGTVIQTKGESSAVTMKYALEFIREKSGGDQQFFAVIWFGNPHVPLKPTKKLKELYPEEKPRRQNYFGEISGIDQAMGSLRKELRKLGVAENTLVWYTSDNGPARGFPEAVAGLRGRKGQLWEGGIRVPCVIEWPAGISSPQKVSTPSSTSDIFPTVLELAGVEMPHSRPLDGISIASLFSGEDMASRPPMKFWVYRRKGIAWKSAGLLETQRDGGPPPERTPGSRLQKKFEASDRQGHATIVDNQWKLHRLAGQAEPSFELYDLQNDPAENQNVADNHPEITQRLKEQLDQWQSSVIDSLNGKDYQ